MKTVKNDEEDGWWRCDEDGCNTLNPPKNIRCYECDEKKPIEEDEVKTSSLTENMNFKFPGRMIPY